MTEITQADRDAATDSELFPCPACFGKDELAPSCSICSGRGIVADPEAFARHRKYGYDQGYYDGRQFDRMEERAAIVAWLRSDKIVLSMDGSKEDVVASAIEAGEHLK